MPYRSAPLVIPPPPYRHSLWRRLVRLWWRFLRWRAPRLTRVHCIRCCAAGTETYRGRHEKFCHADHHLCSDFEACDTRQAAMQDDKRVVEGARGARARFRAGLRWNRERHYADYARWLLYRDLLRTEAQHRVIVLAEAVEEEHERIKRLKGPTTS